jgi:BlaI family penicillinase repressor
MDRKTAAQLTEVELQILGVLWELGPSPVRDIHSRLEADKGTNYSTTVKMLSVILQKGLVTRTENERPHVYPAKVSRKIAGKRMMKDVIREYRDLVSEQGDYPRPRTASRASIDAMWRSFCDGNIDIAVAKRQSESDFDAKNLELLFAAKKIDVFTTARLLNQVEKFRPAGWREWVKSQLRSDIPWARAFLMSQLPQPVDPVFRPEIAINMENIYPAVQAEALMVAAKSPSADYIPVLRRVAESNDKWIGPAAKSTLMACLAAEKQEEDKKRKNRRKNGSPIQTTKKWQDLLNQPAIQLVRGEAMGDARLGVEAARGPVGSGILLYCLTTGYERPSRWRKPKRLGPFTVEVRHESENEQLIEADVIQVVAEKAPIAKALFRDHITLERAGKYRVTVRSLDGVTVGVAELIAEQTDYHPWMPLGQATFPWGSLNLTSSSTPSAVRGIWRAESHFQPWME